ncbi:MAG TPA: KGG domain-containing protein [bacterium]|nr:KGG domain-containing protein [bacterium]
MANRKMRDEEEDKGRMTVEEAGRKGGEKTSETHGREFYQEIGHKGGEVGGEKGGKATRDKYGPEFYSEIGHKGGERVRELIEEGKESEKR